MGSDCSLLYKQNFITGHYSEAHKFYSFGAIYMLQNAIRYKILRLFKRIPYYYENLIIISITTKTTAQLYPESVLIVIIV